ncbi:hypothetical protein RRG08_064497 [Elysia crispata]|uniref:Uncharacterized protein n=1 Tax=Elysia crispata TaxID=231223 RepID=A0AAE1DYG7_9GAST|nr:hypothetical protein RRG08_064497 [Elysia crispata]
MDIMSESAGQRPAPSASRLELAWQPWLALRVLYEKISRGTRTLTVIDQDLDVCSMLRPGLPLQQTPQSATGVLSQSCSLQDVDTPHRGGISRFNLDLVSHLDWPQVQLFLTVYTVKFVPPSSDRVPVCFRGSFSSKPAPTMVAWGRE